MDGSEVLDRILSSACHNGPDGNGWNTYRISLHCVDFDVVARPSRKVWIEGEYDYTEYAIQDLTPVAPSATVAS